MPRKNKNTPYTDSAKVVASDTKTALQTLFDNIPKGQRKQMVKIAEIKELFDRYGVEYEES